MCEACFGRWCPSGPPYRALRSLLSIPEHLTMWLQVPSVYPEHPKHICGRLGMQPSLHRRSFLSVSLLWSQEGVHPWAHAMDLRGIRLPTSSRQPPHLPASSLYIADYFSLNYASLPFRRLYYIIYPYIVSCNCNILLF